MYYNFHYLDADGNETKSKLYIFDNIQDAEYHAKKQLAGLQDDTQEITITPVL